MSENSDRVRELKWELDRAICTLNEENTYLAACAVWDVTGTLLITLINDRKNTNPHLLALQKFLHEEWKV